MTIIDHLSDRDLPMCPVGPGQPGYESHRIADMILDAFHAAADKIPETGEFTSPEVNQAYVAAARVARSPMRLHRETLGYDIQITGHILHTGLQAHYLRCPICGFTMHVDRISRISHRVEAT